MFYDQSGVDEQYYGVVESSPAYPEVFLVSHERVEGVYVKMSFYGVYSVKYGIAFGRFAMSVRGEVFGEYLPYRILYVWFVHRAGLMGDFANKINSFLYKRKEAVVKSGFYSSVSSLTRLYSACSASFSEAFIVSTRRHVRKAFVSFCWMKRRKAVAAAFLTW